MECLDIPTIVAVVGAVCISLCVGFLLVAAFNMKD